MHRQLLVLFSFFILVLRIAGFNCRGTTISSSEEGGGVGSSSRNSPLLSKYSLLPLFSTIFLLSSSCSEVQSRAILLNFILMGPGPDPSSVTALFLKYRGHKSHFYFDLLPARVHSRVHCRDENSGASQRPIHCHKYNYVLHGHILRVISDVLSC